MTTPQVASELTSFRLFPRLPAELRLLIWESAVDNVPRVIRLQYRNGQLAKFSVPLEALQLACMESYKAYKNHKQLHDVFVFYEPAWRYQVDSENGEIYAIQGKGRKHEFPVSFDRDFFLITGTSSPDFVPSGGSQLDLRDPLGLRVLYQPAQPFAKQLKNVILPAKLSGNISDLLYSRGNFGLTNLQELWVLLSGSGAGFRPEPESKFQHHCPLHHHNVLPSKYCRIDNGPAFWDRGMEICPACDWETGNWGDVDGAAIRLRHDNFRITYDATLHKYPRLQEIFRARIPVIRWVRNRKGSEASKDLYHTRGSDPTAIACLTSTGAMACSH
ncbi:hypothetical protein V8F33_009060 [Rhypophila sp. PSN 637]